MFSHKFNLWGFLEYAMKNRDLDATLRWRQNGSVLPVEANCAHGHNLIRGKSAPWCVFDKRQKRNMLRAAGMAPPSPFQSLPEPFRPGRAYATPRLETCPELLKCAEPNSLAFEAWLRVSEVLPQV